MAASLPFMPRQRTHAACRGLPGPERPPQRTGPRQPLTGLRGLPSVPAAPVRAPAVQQPAQGVPWPLWAAFPVMRLRYPTRPL